jgi:hypothetical protein
LQRAQLAKEESWQEQNGEEKRENQKTKRKHIQMLAE